MRNTKREKDRRNKGFPYKKINRCPVCNSCRLVSRGKDELFCLSCGFVHSDKKSAKISIIESFLDFFPF